MAPPKNSMSVNLAELYAHATKVVQVQQPLDRVLAAVREVTPTGVDSAYGIVCQPFAWAIMPVRERAEDAVKKLSTSITATSEQLIQTVDHYDGTDQANAKRLRAIGADLPANDKNWLVDSSSQFSWKAYDVTDGGPLTAGKEDNWLAGSGALDDCKQIYDEITDSSKQNHALLAGHVASLGLNELNAANDPIGTVAAWGASWLMEHIKPLKFILDSLAGHPDMIKGAAETWQNIGNELNRLGKHYAAAVTAGTGNWQGEAANAYRRDTASNTVDALLAAGKLAHTMSIVVGSTGELVNLVRTVIRDLIAELVGKAVKAGLKRLGVVVPTNELGEIVAATKKGKALLDFLIKLTEVVGGRLPMVVEAYKTVANIVPKLNGI